jgi:ABC-type multidrug transport system ATPase subunit
MTDPGQDDGQKPPGTKGALVQAKGVTICTRAGQSLLSDISFHIEPGELVALAGLSRSGKSTLLQSLAGLVEPESGEILIDGIALYANLKAFRPVIGYVPAEFAWQPQLTVTEILQDGARLRLPGRTADPERERRVQALLETAGLTHAANTRAGDLSRVEKRRLNIALELMGDPGLLLLDESAEQLTPFEEVQTTILLRDLSRQGLTIIQVDQRSRSAGLSDKVIFLGPGGMLAWFGPPDEAFIHLRNLVPRGVAKDLFGLKEALEVLANPQPGEGIEWAEKFRNHEAFDAYVDDPLHNKFPDLLLLTRPLLRMRLRSASEEKLPPPIIPRATGIQKFILYIRRSLRLLWRERTLPFMAATPAAIALVYFVLSSGAMADPGRAPILLGLLAFLVLLTATLLVQNEISKEAAVFQRENRNSSIAASYTLSKVWLAGVLAIYQGLVWAALQSMVIPGSRSLQTALLHGIVFSLVAFIGGILGLTVSAVAGTARPAANWIALLTVPQLILSGAFVPLSGLGFPFSSLAAINPLRYAWEALMTAGGYSQALNVPMLNDWLALAILILCLVVILVLVQRRARSLKL